MSESQRFLRSNKKRNALYAAADGMCQNCGKELASGWDADHVEPWSVTGRTNIYEMEALCPDCNNVKGNKMPDAMMPEQLQVNLSRLRRGQRGALTTLIGRVTKFYDKMTEEKTDERGAPYIDTFQHTSLILPYGYGKSDVIRVGGVELAVMGYVGSIIVVNPAKYLVTQIMDPKTMQEKAAFYNLPRRPEILNTFHMKEFKLQYLDKKGYGFFGMTMSMLAEGDNIKYIANWVDSHIHRRGMPPLIFIDEAHSASEANTWGACIQRLGEAGAALCLLTATPYRSDETEIAGFRYVDEYTTRSRVAMPVGTPDLFINLHERKAVVKRLLPDYEYTLYEAWREEPPVICTVDCVTFDIDLGHLAYESDTEYTETRWLSQLNPDEVEAHLGKILRQWGSIRLGVETMGPEFLRMRKLITRNKCLIYAASDEPNTPLEDRNKHAFDIKAEIERQYPGQFTVKIATSTIEDEHGDAAGLIDEFKKPSGPDILIVKQMAGTGLDVPAITTVLDLSPTRTLVSWSQRIMRGDRPVQRDGGELMDKFDLITPADCISKDLYEKLIKGLGGDTVQRVSNPGGERGEGGEGELADLWVVLGGNPSDMKDSWGYEAKGSAKGIIDEVLDEIPELVGASRSTRPIISKIADIVMKRDEGGSADAPIADTPPPPPALDRQEQEEALRYEANAINDQIAAHYLKQAGGSTFGEMARSCWKHLIFNRLRMKWKSLPARDLEELQRIVAGLHKWREELGL